MITSRVRRSGMVTAIALVAGLLSSMPPAASAAPAQVPLPGAPVYVADGATGLVRFYNHSQQAPGIVATEYGGAIDDFAVGDADGNGTDDLIVANAFQGTVDIHYREGQAWQKQTIAAGYNVPTFQSDRMVAGDLDGNGSAEILVARAVTGQVLVYNRDGSRLEARPEFPTSFGAGDPLAMGDVAANGDGVQELVVADGPAGDVTIYSVFGFVGRFHTPHLDSKYDGVSVGDFNVDGIDEILIADASSGQVTALDRNGAVVATGIPTRFDAGAILSESDQFTSGDVDGDGHSELVVANAPGGELDARFSDGTVAVTSTVFDDAVTDQVVVGTKPLDTDGDGIPDIHEQFGLRDAAGNMAVDLPALGASPCRETIVVEIDYMDGPNGGFTPDQRALDLAKAAFDKAPRPAAAACPYANVDTRPGVTLVAYVDQRLPSEPQTGSPQEFNAIKRAAFRPELSPYVHYSPWVDHVVVGGQAYGGYCCYGAANKDFLGESEGDVTEQASTFMHELGHALGIGHGGGDSIGQKPNYFSVMNPWYAHTGVIRVQGVPPGTEPDPILEFSSEVLPDLKEDQLSEPAGVPGIIGTRFPWYDKFGTLRHGYVNMPVDWTGDNNDGIGTTDDDNPVSVDLNGDGQTQTLHGHDDWRSIHFGGSVNIRRAAQPTELTVAQSQQIVHAWDAATAPERTLTFGTPPPGQQAVTLAVAENADKIYVTRYLEEVAEPHKSTEPGELLVLDKASLNTLKRVTVGFNPHSVAVNPATKRVYVVNRGKESYSLSVLDGTTFDTVATVKLGQTPIDVAVNSRTNRVYVSNPSQGTIQVVDGATNQLLPPIAIGPGALGLAVDESTNQIYAALSHRSAELTVNALGLVTDDGHTVKIHPKIPIAEITQPIDVAVDQATDRVYVANLGGMPGVGPQVTVLRRSNQTVLKSVPLTAAARGISVNGYAHKVFVASDNGVQVIDDHSLTVIRTIPAGYAPYGVATVRGAGRELYAVNRHGELYRLNYSS